MKSPRGCTHWPGRQVLLPRLWHQLGDPGLRGSRPLHRTPTADNLSNKVKGGTKSPLATGALGPLDWAQGHRMEVRPPVCCSGDSGVPAAHVIC